MLTTKLTAIADAIRSKTGETATMTLADMPNKISGISGSEDVEWHQCPELVRNYLANVTYDASDYTTSQIANYAPSTAVESNYRPIGVTVGAETYYNQEPNVQTPFANSAKVGTLKPLDQVRWIKTSAANVRDLGGWACDGGTVKYGLLFRGGYCTVADRAVLVNELETRNELNLMWDYPEEAGHLGGAVRTYTTPQSIQYTLSPTSAWKDLLSFIFEAVEHNETVYFHCFYGSDRTGTVACVIEGLLGVSQSDIDKDYELSCFYSGTGTDSDARRRNESEWQGLINQINAKSGSTFRDKCVTFVAELGFTAAEINAFRAAMIDGTPETVTPSIATYTVTNTLANVTSDNGVTSATQYQPYTANITPTTDKIIDSIKVTMGGVDVTNQVFKGTTDILRRSITQTLTACASSNTRTYVIDGQGYVTTLTAITGYAIDSVTITMGGVDVSTFYKDGIISIPNVTGDIVITATAVAQAPSFTNLVPTSIGTDGNIYNSVGYKNDTRLRTNGIDEATLSGQFATGFFPIDIANDIVYVKGATWNNDYTKFVIYNTEMDTKQADAPYQSGAWASTYLTATDMGNGVTAFVFKAFSGSAYMIRLSAVGDGANVIITKNEEIT